MDYNVVCREWGSNSLIPKTKFPRGHGLIGVVKSYAEPFTLF